MARRTLDEEIEGIKELLNYVTIDHKAGSILWSADVGQRARKGIAAGSVTKDGYTVIMFKRRGYLLHRVVYFSAKGELPQFIDHKKGIEYGNGIDNLREATLAENSKNRKVKKGKSIPYLGVRKHGNKYRADIKIDGKQTYIGLGSTMEEAARLYDEAAKKNHGEFASLNFG